MYKVLIVDDCSDDVKGLVEYVPWAELQCEVVGTADNGFDGVELAFKLKPHIVITDISMPRKSGIEMAEKISMQNPETMFVYMSCFSSFEYAKKAVKTNAVAYVLKPIDINELKSALKNAISILDEKSAKTERYDYLNEQFEKNKEALRENYLVSLLQGTENNKAYRELFDFYPDEKYCICILKVQNQENAGLGVLYKQITYMRRLIKENIPDIYSTKFELDKIAAVVDKNSIAETEKVFLQFQNLFASKFNGASLLVYITRDSFVLEEFPKQFQNLINIIKNNYFEMKEQIIYIDTGMLNSQTAGSSPSVSMIYDDVYSVLNGDTEINDFEAKYFFDGAFIDTVYLKSLCYLVICIINIFLIERNKSFDDIFGNDILVWEKLSDFQSIKNVKQWLFNIFSAAKSFVSETQDVDKTAVIVREIKSYIDKNYANLDVVEDAVRRQGISLNYARKIFKNKENQTIFDYLISKRMMEAKQLLATTNLPVNEIAEMVGYFSNTYFSTAFKKYTGTNPQKYRDGN